MLKIQKVPHKELQLEHRKSNLHASVNLLLEKVVRLGWLVRDDLVILRFSSLRHHTGIVVIIEYALPYYVGRRVDILHDETSATRTVARLNLSLIRFPRPQDALGFAIEFDLWIPRLKRLQLSLVSMRFIEITSRCQPEQVYEKNNALHHLGRRGTRRRALNCLRAAGPWSTLSSSRRK